MNKTTLHRLFFLLIFLLSSAMPLFADNISGGHRGGITALIHKGDTVISSGDDGFIVTWDVNQRKAVERFQLTTHRITATVSHPLRDEICVIEAGGVDNYRISAWNYTRRERLFSIHSTVPITYINYSSGGNSIIAAGLHGFPLALLDSSTGEIVSTPVISAGRMLFGITGRAERNMLIYQSENEEYFEQSGYAGQILYLNLDSGNVTDSFQAPDNISAAVILGNNRFIAGVSSYGLQLVDAASGEILDTVENIERSAILCPSNEGFYCLSRRNNASILYNFSIDRNTKFVIRQEIPLSFENAGQISFIAYNGSVVFSTSQGSLYSLGRQNNIIPFGFNFQTRITEIAAGETNIAILTENGDLLFLPLDYRRLGRNEILTPVNKNNYDRLSSLSLSGEDFFILWQAGRQRIAPQFVSVNRRDGNNMDSLLGRLPLRSVSSLGNMLLLLDSGGNLTVRNLEKSSNENLSADLYFSFSTVGAIDASFINNEYIILSRSVINNSSPFLSVNIRTGETIPHFYPVQAGLMVYAGRTGSFAAAVERDADGIMTVVYDLSISSPEGRIFRYPGETSYLSIVESGGRLAISCGSEGAAIYTNGQVINFERTPGLPVKLLASGNFFLCLDSEGNIAWHDNRGRLLSVFSLREDSWTLLTSGRETTGEINRR